MPRKQLVLAACLVVSLAIAAAAALEASSRGGHAAVPAKPRRGACTLTRSVSGYPDRYVRRLYPYTTHPPLPDTAWHGPASAVPAKVLFHSLFHGYVTVEYRPDLPVRALRVLRGWVLAHADARVVATPAAASAPALDVAEWGWELSCPRSVPPAGTLSRFAARRGA